MDRNEPFVIYRTLEKFLEHRSKETSETFKLSQDQFIDKFESQGFYKIETTGKNKLMILILSETGRYYIKTADFVRLIQTNKWEELVVVVPRGFFLKKNFVSKAQDIFRNAKKEHEHFGVYPYGIFTIEIPRHESVPKHTVMSKDEAKTVTDYYLMNNSELSTAFHTDPGFPTEPFPVDLASPLPGRREYLESDNPVQRHVEGTVNDAHSAGPDSLDDLVVVDDLTGGQ